MPSFCSSQSLKILTFASVRLRLLEIESIFLNLYFSKKISFILNAYITDEINVFHAPIPKLPLWFSTNVFHNILSVEITSLISRLHGIKRSTRSISRNDQFTAEITKYYTNSYFINLFNHTSRTWNALPASWFPLNYDRQ